MAKSKKANKPTKPNNTNNISSLKQTEKKSKKRSFEESNQDQYEDLGQMDSWDWNEVNTSTSFMGDDNTGFLCLEEISDVEIDYEGDDKTGKIMKFKVKINK